MTEIEKIHLRQESVRTAITAVQAALSTERKFSAEKPSGHFTAALTELNAIALHLELIEHRHSK